MALSFPIYKNHNPFACPLQSLRGLAHKGYQPNHKIIDLEGPGANVTIIPTSTNVNDPYKYKFGGKEYQEEFDVNVYDFGARNYDPSLGRWMNVDPLAEDYYSQSSYQYTLNNPIVYIDPDGMKVDMTHLMKTGNEGLQTAIGMLFDLTEQTGLSLSIQKNKDGRFMLEYDTDSTNEWMYEIDGVRAGSEDARNQLMGMIDNETIALVGLRKDNSGSGVPRGSNIIYMGTNVGTGLRLSVMLHLPGLKMTGELEKMRRAAQDMGLAVRGFYGEGSESPGEFYQLSNQTTLGKSDDMLLHEMEHEIIPRVVGYERHARKNLLSNRRELLEDQVWRALGTLRHARMMKTEEAMELLSMVRLGVMLGLVEGVKIEQVHALLLATQPTHLQRTLGTALTQQQRRIERAALVRKQLTPS